MRRGLQLSLLAAAVAAGTYSQTALGPLQETMRAALSLTDNQMALLQGPALGLPVLLVSLPLGIAIDRYSRVRLLFLFAVINLLGSAFTALAPSFPLLFAARCLAGLTVTAAWMASLSLLTDLYAPDERGRANMIVIIGQCIGGAAAFALGGMLLSMFDFGASSWRWAMLGLTVPLLPIVFMMLAMREPPRADRLAEPLSTRQAFVELWHYRAATVPLLIGVAMFSIANGAVMTWAAPMLSRNFAQPVDRIGAIMAMVFLVSGLLGPIAGGYLADHCQRIAGPRRTMRALGGLALLGIPVAFYAAAPGVVSVSAFLLVFMTIVGAVVVTGTTLFTIVVPSHLLGLLTAILSAVFLLLGLGAAPLSVSLLSGALGGPALIGKALSLVCIAVSVLAAAAFVLGRRHFPSTATR